MNRIMADETKRSNQTMFLYKLVDENQSKSVRTSYHLTGIRLAPPEAVNRAGYSEPPATVWNQQ